MSYARGGRAKEEDPVMVFFTGTPGCRLHWWAHKYCEKYGIQMFCFDRPGYGYTTLRIGDGMMHHIKDVEEVLDHPDVKTFTTHGTSGGGPYALAAADYFSKNRLEKTTIMCGATDSAYEEISVKTSWRLQRFDGRFFPGLFESWANWKGYNRFYRDPKLSEEQNDRERRTCMEKNRQGQSGYANDITLRGRFRNFD
jgi:pimeloyl-ACP methyl ester carboxylesterase